MRNIPGIPEGLTSQDHTASRAESATQGVRGLFLMNGGGAVALLAFLQAVLKTDPGLAVYVIFGVGALSLGMFSAGLVHFLRYHASFSFQARNPKWTRWRKAYLFCEYLSLAFFLVGVGIVLVGAYVAVAG